jgi:hypothetical protein
MKLNQCLERVDESRGKAQLEKPEDRVETLKLIAKDLKNVIGSPSQNLINSLSAQGAELLHKISEATVNYDLQKYLIMEKALMLENGDLATKPGINDILTLVCLQSRDEIKKLASEVDALYGKGYSEEDALDWLKKKTKGELAAAQKRYSEKRPE